MLLYMYVSLLLGFCLVCLCAYAPRGQFNVYVIDYIRAAVSFSPEQFRDKEAMNSDSNLKHQGHVIIKIYDAIGS